MKKLIVMVLSLALALSLCVCTFAVESFDPTLDISTSADGTTITVTMKDVPDGVLAELSVSCKGWDNAVVKDSSGKTVTSIFDATMDTVTFAAEGGTYSITKNSTPTGNSPTGGPPAGHYPTTTEPEVISADTFDGGIALYVGISVIGAIGTVALSKKRED